MNQAELLTPEELASILKIKPWTVKQWSRSGRIPEIRFSGHVRRYRLADVLRAVEGKKTAKGRRA